MPPPPPSVRLACAEPLRPRLAAAARAAGLAVVEAPDVELLVADTLAAALRHVPSVLVCETPGEAEWAALRDGSITELVSPAVSDAELAARFARAAAAIDTLKSEPWRGEVEQLLSLVRDLATSGGGLDALLHRIVARLADLAGVERCSLILFDGPTRPPTHGAVVATSDRSDLYSLRIDFSRYPEIRECLRTEAPVIVGDVAHHPLLDPVRERLAQVGVGSLAVFPLAEESGLIGVLLMRSREPLRSPDRLRLGSTAAIATAIAVRHGQLVEAVRGEAARQLEGHAELVAHLSDGVVVVDAQQKVLLANRAARLILSLPDELSGRRLSDLVPPVDPIAAQLVIRELTAGGRLLNADLEVQRPDGSRAVLSLSAGHMRGRRVVFSFRDVTEQRAVERDVRRTRDFLERLIDASTDAIVASDLDGKMLVFNRAAEKLYGLQSGEARQRLSVRDLYPQGGAEEIMRLLRASPSGQIESVRAYGQAVTGEIFPVELSAALVRQHGREVATVGFLRDLRERVRVEAELSRARSRLSDAEKQAAITAIAGATAHELNQPLTVVLGSVELLRRRAPATAGPLLDTLATEADRMSQIVKKISKLTRVETVAYPGEKRIADIDRSSEPPPGRTKR